MPGRLALRCATLALVVAAAACGGGPPGGPTPPPVEGPAVQSITPNIGPLSGGTEVTIRGLRFAAGASVTIGGAAATDVAVQGTDTITAKSPPAAAAGPATVVVTVAGRSGSLPAGFTYAVPPANNPPVITAIAAQGTKAGEPPDFADLGETIAVSATVRDDETAADQLEYRWTAAAGTFEGTGARVTWRAPEGVATPLDVTITLRVVERYGTGGVFQQEATATRSIAVHDSVRELGDMARRFLTEFSKPQTNKDVGDIMRDFKASACPDPDEVEAEREQVITHYTNFIMHAYDVGTASVQVIFRQRRCVANLEGDACISVPVRWESTDSRNNGRGSTSGTDHLTGVYARSDKRWWLCSSLYEQTGNFGPTFYSVR